MVGREGERGEWSVGRERGGMVGREGERGEWSVGRERGGNGR